MGKGGHVRRDAWLLVQDVVHQHVVAHMVASYRHVNDFLVHHGVLPDVEAASKVKRVKSAPPPRKRSGGGASQTDQSADGSGDSGGGGGGGGSGGGGGRWQRMGPRRHGSQCRWPGWRWRRRWRSLWLVRSGSRSVWNAVGLPWQWRPYTALRPYGRNPHDDGRRPLARARMRASGMLGQLSR